ncbi:MAG: hypothetical protein QOD77_1867 [Thermoplasmata archaeon]|jgi:predicted RND superfamily exporter protein|nr:hypothetical protein [Thermoplasmata archaeon]
MAKLDDAVADGLASISIACSRHAGAVVAVVLLLTGVFGYGVSTITTDVDVADVLPRGNYNTEAAHNLTEKFRSTFTQQVTLQLHVDEAGHDWAKDNAKLTYRNLGFPANGAPAQVKPDSRNITDEVYIRATAELVEFLQAQTDFTRTISISNIYSLINWTVAGGDGSGGTERAPESAFALPGYRSQADAVRYQLVDQTVKAAILDTVDAITSPKWDHAAALFMPPADNTRSSRDLGAQMLAARDAWLEHVRAGDSEFTVFGPANPPLFTVDLPIANAHSSELVQQDTLRLMPMIAAFILACLFVAFRNLRAIAVSFTTLAIGVVWSYGTMGFMGIPLNTLNMTIVPLVMGIGIDYSIHIINEFAEHKSRGFSDQEAFRQAGRRSGLAMLIATATTVAGLVVLVFSPSLLIADLGLIATVALTVLYLLAITFIPAALTLLGGSTRMGAKFTPSRIMPAIARGVTRARWLVVVLLLAVSVVAYPLAESVGKEAFGDPGRNYLPDDPIRREHEAGLADFYGSTSSDEKANILAFSGPGILTPDAIRYYRAIEANLKNESRVIDDTLRTVPFFIETWLTVKGGAPGAAQSVALSEILGIPIPIPVPPADDPRQQLDPFPATEQAIRAEVNAMFGSPMRELSSIILNHPANDMAAMTFSVNAGTFEQAEQVWGQVWHAVAAANATMGGAPAGIKVAFIGNTATNYLFIAEELPWLTYMALVNNVVLAVLVLATTRSIKITLVIAILSVLTTLWWLAILPSFGIGMAITLTLPFAFITAIGTDYGVHFMWNIRQTGDAREVFESTGKAVLFSAVTTTGAFVFFIAVQNVAVARTMLATTLAFAIIFLVTVLVVPVFFPVERKRRRAHRNPPPPIRS